MELFHVRLSKLATMPVWKWFPACCGSNSTKLNFPVPSSDAVFGRRRRSSLKQQQRDANPESRSEWSSVSKPALSSRRTKTGFFHLGYLKQAIHHPERNCLAAMKCTKGRLNFFFHRLLHLKRVYNFFGFFVFGFFSETGEQMQIKDRPVTQVKLYKDELKKRGCIQLEVYLKRHQLPHGLTVIRTAHVHSASAQHSPRSHQIIQEPRRPRGDRSSDQCSRHRRTRSGCTRPWREENWNINHSFSSSGGDSWE